MTLAGKVHPRAGRHLMGVTINATPPSIYFWERDPTPTMQAAGWEQVPLRTGAESVTLHRDSIPGPSNP
jgi:hypothetical protein